MKVVSRPIRHFEDLECWKACRDLRRFVAAEVVPKFCSNARGSCWEVLDHLITAADEGFAAEESLNRGRELVAHAVRLINGYMKYLKRTTVVPNKQ